MILFVLFLHNNCGPRQTGVTGAAVVTSQGSATALRSGKDANNLELTSSVTAT